MPVRHLDRCSVKLMRDIVAEKDKRRCTQLNVTGLNSTIRL